MLEFFKQYPEFISVCVAIASTSFGFLLKALIDFSLDKYKNKTELRNTYWKEKIEAAKKATEYYTERIGQYEIIIENLNLMLSQKGVPKTFNQSFQENFKKFLDKFDGNSTYQYHHINLFFNINEQELKEVTRNIYSLVRDLHIQIEKSNNNEDIDLAHTRKLVLKLTSELQKKCNQYRGFLTIIREDIKSFIR